MGAYAYCDECGGGLPGPWDLRTRDLLKVLSLGDDEPFLCKGCGYQLDNYFYNEDILDELAERIDKKA